MTNNPYAAPESNTVTGINSGTREDLQQVATAQKGILVCILVYIGMLVAAGVFPYLKTVFQVAVLVVGLVSVRFVFMLAMRVYSTGLGIVLGILTLIPCIGLLILLIVNQKATTILQQNGIKVGLLGAKMPA